MVIKRKMERKRKKEKEREREREREREKERERGIFVRKYLLRPHFLRKCKMCKNLL